MNLEQHKKAWEDFKDWYNKQSYPINFDSANGNCNIPFIKQPFDNQLGVYLRYLDEKCIPTGRAEMAGDYWCMEYTKESDYDYYENLNSYGEAIEQAFKMVNVKLTK